MLMKDKTKSFSNCFSRIKKYAIYLFVAGFNKKNHYRFKKPRVYAGSVKFSKQLLNLDQYP